MVSIDHAKVGWPAPRMPAWQRDMYNLRRMNSDLSEGMHSSIGGFYLPADMLPYGSYIFTEKHSSLAAGRGLSAFHNMNYPTACMWHHGGFSPQMGHWSREVDWGVQGYIIGSAHCAHAFTKARNHERMGQVICRYSSSCLVGRKSEGARGGLPLCRSASLARGSSLKHFLPRAKSSKQWFDRTNTGCREKPTPALPFVSAQQEPNRLANEASQPNPRSEKDLCKDHFDGLMPVDPVSTLSSTSPLAVKGCGQEDFKSMHSPAMKERWAGPAFANSPPPSSLPVPSFTRRPSRTSSLEIPQVADSIYESLSAAKCRVTSIAP